MAQQKLSETCKYSVDNVVFVHFVCFHNAAEVALAVSHLEKVTQSMYNTIDMHAGVRIAVTPYKLAYTFD